MCKPVFPLIQDELAHIFWKTHHITTVHNHHGDHHAEKEIATVAHNEENNKMPSTSKSSEPVSIHIIVQASYNTPQVFIKKTKYERRIYNVFSLFLDKKYPPPRFC